MLSTTELIQLLKMPVLVEHFAEHKAKNPGITILDFVTLHYNGDHLDNHPDDDDYDQDKNLPFITHSNVLTISCVGTPDFRFELKKEISQRNKLDQIVYDDFFDAKSYLSAIWQPPKFC